MKNKLIFTFILGLTLQSHANLAPGFQFTFGATSLPLNAVTTSPTAKKDTLGELYNPLGFKYIFESSSAYQLSASLSTTQISLLTNKDKDKGTSNFMTQVGSDLYFSSSSKFNFKSQFGIMLYQIKGSGGTVELNNGAGTATFDLPSRSSSSQTVYVGIGGQYDFGSFNIDTNLNFLSLLSSTRRSYFLSIGIGVPL